MAEAITVSGPISGTDKTLSFETGLLRLRDVVYYLGVTYVFLFAAIRVLEARRWR